MGRFLEHGRKGLMPGGLCGAKERRHTCSRKRLAAREPQTGLGTCRIPGASKSRHIGALLWSRTSSVHTLLKLKDDSDGERALTSDDGHDGVVT